MKSCRLAVLVVTATGLIAYSAGRKLIYAASGEGQSVKTPVGAEQADRHAENMEGAQVYQTRCAICHGEQREGILPYFPPVLGIKRQRNDQQITLLLLHGKGRMPAFPKLQGQELTDLLRFLSTDLPATSAEAPSQTAELSRVHPSRLSEAGGSIFQQNCAFCHGRDAGGGETGPDLTRSKLVTDDVDGNKITEVVRNGRPEKKMPAFNFSDQEMLGLVAFVHSQQAKALAMKGKRRGVDVSDLQTGNVEEGKRYFNGAGTCAKCHSATTDLAGVASRYQGLQLEQRMLYPKDAKSRVSVSLPSGKTIAGSLAYLDEFTIGLRDSEGRYRSWSVNNVKYVLDSPVDAHVDLFSKYTDADIHNLMAYMQTLR